MHNQDIRSEVKNAGLKLWMIADAFHVAEATFIKKLRHELPEAEKVKIRVIINELKKLKEGV